MALLAAFAGAAGALQRAGRPRASARRSPAATAREMEGLIGFFVNTLVAARRSVGRSDASRELLGRVRAHHPRRLRPSGPAVRAPGRGAGPGARSGAAAAVPGHPRAPEQLARWAARADGLDTNSWRPTRHGQARPRYSRASAGVSGRINAAYGRLAWSTPSAVRAAAAVQRRRPAICLRSGGAAGRQPSGSSSLRRAGAALVMERHGGRTPA